MTLLGKSIRPFQNPPSPSAKPYKIGQKIGEIFTVSATGVNNRAIEVTIDTTCFAFRSHSSLTRDTSLKNLTGAETIIEADDYRQTGRLRLEYADGFNLKL